MAKSKTHTSKNYATPGKPMSQAEFEAMIKEAEEGPFTKFTSIEDFKKDVLEGWKRKYGK